MEPSKFTMLTIDKMIKDTFESATTREKCSFCTKYVARKSCKTCYRTYCGPVCTEQDWNEHVKTCAKFWATTDAWCKNDLIRNWVPCPKAVSRYICYCCYQTNWTTFTSKCGICKTARYCSIKCQKKDWNAYHKKLCGSYQRKYKTEAFEKTLENCALIAGKSPCFHWILVKDEKALPEKYLNMGDVILARHCLMKQDKGIYVIEQRTTLNVLISQGEDILKKRATAMLKLK